MTYVKVNKQLYPAMISGNMVDKSWDNRESKSITMVIGYENINTLFKDDTKWSIVQKETVTTVNEQNEEVTEIIETEFDNSDFNIRGDLTVHTDGTCTVKMGKATDLESAYTLLYGGIK